MGARCETIGRFIIGVVGVALLVSSSAVTVTAAPDSFALMCRGGNLMSYSVRKPEGTVTFEVFFRRAPTAGSVSPPGPGTCAWIDRPVRTDEPNRFRIVAAGPLSVACGYLAGRSGAERCLLRNAPADIWRIREHIRQGRPFQVRVYNDRHGVFIVNRVGP